MKKLIFKKNLKNFIFFLTTSLCSVVIVGMPFSSAAESDYMPNYSPIEIDYPGTNVVFHIGEVQPLFKSDLGNYTSDGSKRNSCTSIEDPDCSFDAKSVAYAASLLPPCADSSSTNCIVGLQMTSASGEIQKAKLVKELGGYTIPVNPAKGYIGGRSASVWEIGGETSSSAKSKFLIAPQFYAWWDKDRLTFEVNKFSVSIFPIVQKSGDFFADRWATELERIDYANNPSSQFRGVELKYVPKVKQGNSNNDFRDCIVFDDNYCAQHTIFKAESRVKLDLRLTNKLGGWFHGRIKDPIISIEKINDFSNLVSVDAEPIMIPRLTHVVDLNSLDSMEKQLYDKTFWGGGPPRELYAGPLSDTGETGFEFLNAFRDKVGDASSGVTSAWNFNSVNSGSGSRCLSQKGKVLGIVSTNATVFESTAPRFNDGQLEYKVSGLHFQRDRKSENLGTYDLVINSDVARCIYGFTNAPISASVSISGGSDQKIATTVINEKNGWLKLAAYGFTFSEKILQVKLAQEPVAVTPTPTPIPSASVKPVVKAQSITCIKGKVIKKVNAVNPTCPKGYKKK